MSVREHEDASQSIAVRVSVVTVSDTRDAGDDPSGDLMADLLTAADYEVVSRSHVPDDRDAIYTLLKKLIADDDVDAVLLTGGTGCSRRDVTPEALSELIEKPMPGFGEIFRGISFAEPKVGTAALLSRALAGTTGRTFIAALPGSPNAVRLGMERLVIPMLRHIVQQLGR